MSLEIMMLKTDQIIPYWRNPRDNDEAAREIAKAIQTYGFNVPLVVDRDHVVIKGHARLKAAKLLGMETVPCIISTASAAMNKADRIADNKIQELSKWDEAKLEIERVVLDGSPLELLFEPKAIPIAHVTGVEPMRGEPSQAGVAGAGAIPPSTEERMAMPAGDRPDGDAGGEQADSDAPRLWGKVVCPTCGAVTYV